MTTENGCKHAAGEFIPLIDRSRCEGKAQCVRVCPVGVYVVGTLPPGQRTGLGLRGTLKGMAHRWQQALLVNPGACEGCGLCVTACPEKAITLARA
jgi:4Fe-4S ferredoxin